MRTHALHKIVAHIIEVLGVTSDGASTNRKMMKMHDSSAKLT